MTDQDIYKQLDFINSFVKPWNDLHEFLQQSHSLDPKFSDPVIKSRSMAVATAHQWDMDKKERGQGLTNKQIAAECPAAMRIKDLCNTIKHIDRNKGQDHAWITDISAHVILNDDKQFQFLRNQITYKHEKEGSFDLMDDLRSTISFWAARRGIDLSQIPNWSTHDVRVEPQAPSDTITLVYDPDVCIHQASQRIQLFKLGEANNLIPTTHDAISVKVMHIDDISGLRVTG